MTVADVVERRRAAWFELETLCRQLETRGKPASATIVVRFASLYRSACADLALAEAYQLAPGTVAYLHRLVARSHSQLYRSRGLQLAQWSDLLLTVAPQQIFADVCVRICALLFYGLFTMSILLAWSEGTFPEYPAAIVGQEGLNQMEEMYDEPLQANLDHYVQMAGFYIWHNTGIGLQCFAYGLLIIPCLYTLSVNAVQLGTVFGYMARDSVPQGDNFMHFVTAHGPFELTAIVLSAAAGLRMGLGWIQTCRYRRIDSLRLSALRAVPVMAASAVLFFLAAMTEGFLSPSPAPYLAKAGWAVFSSGLLMFYFVVLGYPRGTSNAA